MSLTHAGLIALSAVAVLLCRDRPLAMLQGGAATLAMALAMMGPPAVVPFTIFALVMSAPIGLRLSDPSSRLRAMGCVAMAAVITAQFLINGPLFCAPNALSLREGWTYVRPFLAQAQLYAFDLSLGLLAMFIALSCLHIFRRKGVRAAAESLSMLGSVVGMALLA